MRFVVIAALLGASPAYADAPIIGGTVDTNDPAVVMIAAYPTNMSTLFTCTGIVVSPTAVLTAAHCVDHPGYTFGIYLGADASAYSTLALLAPQLSAVSATYMNPGYQTTTPFFGDIAVIQLATPTAVTPLPFARSVPPDSLVGAPVEIIGYGQTTYNVPNQVRYSAETSVVSIGASDTILIGDSTHRACVGDSGGPALQNGVVLGVDSYSDTTGCTDPSYFRRTDLFASFIDQYAGTMPTDHPTDAGVAAAADAPLATEPGHSGGGCSSSGTGSGGAVVAIGMCALALRRRRRSAV